MFTTTRFAQVVTRSRRTGKAALMALLVAGGLSGFSAGHAFADSSLGSAPLQRYYSYGAETHWVTTNTTEVLGRGYTNEATLGYLLTTPDPAAITDELFDCVVPGSEDHFVSFDAGCEGQQVLGAEGYIYSTPPAASSVQLFRCILWRGTHWDHFVSTDPACEGQTVEESLGYALTNAVPVPPQSSGPLEPSPGNGAPPPTISNPPTVSAGPAIPTSGTTSDPLGGNAGNGCQMTAASAAAELEAFTLINQHRVAYGSAPLQWDATLSDDARAHSCDMAQQQTLGHVGSDGSMPWDRTGVPLTWENAGGPGSAAESPTYWVDYLDAQMMAEPIPTPDQIAQGADSHSYNIVNSGETRVGIGVIVDGQGQTWLTEDFTS